MTGPRKWNPQRRPRFQGRVFRYVPHHATDPADGSFAQIHGGRWNPSGTFPALHTSCSRDVAIANLWRKHEGRAFQPWELAEEDQPDLYEFELDQEGLIDVVTDAGIAGVGLPASYPEGVRVATTQPIGLRLHGEQRPGVWCRSAALSMGQEIALFLEYSARPRVAGTPLRLADWFPVPPGEAATSE